MSDPAETRAWDFSRRWTGSELMDDPACSKEKLLRTVDQFRLLNRLVSGYRGILGRQVLDDMARRPERECHLVDLGAGGCDIAVWLLGAARRRGLRLRVTALDGDPRLVRHALRQYGSVPGLDIREADLLSMGDHGPVDYIFTQHVLHHLPDEIIPRVLRKMHDTAARRWIVSDLHRSAWTYAGFHLIGPWFRRSFIFADGKRSIHRSFTRPELQAHAAAAGLADCTRVTLASPVRLLLVGEKPG